MSRSLVLIVLVAAGVQGQSCSNTAHAKFFPPWVAGTQTKRITTEGVHCSFEECPPLFNHRAACNKIAIAYHPNMVLLSEPDFAFRSGSSIPRSRFLSDVFNPLHEAFGQQGTSCDNMGSLSVANAQSKSGRLNAGDVLVYVSNQYITSKSNDICQTLKSNGIIILPVFVGTDINLSQLTLMAETQRTVELNQALRSSSITFSSDDAGLILPAVDSGSSKATMGKRRKEAVVLFSRVLAQCPGSCLSKCTKGDTKNGVNTCNEHIKFPTPPEGEPGCCGPQGPPGSAGPDGDQGPPGCTGRIGDDGERGPGGPGGEHGKCGSPGLPGQSGQPGGPGVTGTPGQPGADGPSGDPGHEGPPGLVGPRGKPGVPGVTGGHGPCGPNGSAGGKGPTGPSGAAGSRGCDGIGMIGRNDGHDDAREDLFTRALFEIMQDDDIWNKVYNLGKQHTNSGLFDVEPIKSCSCDSH